MHPAGNFCSGGVGRRHFGDDFADKRLAADAVPSGFDPAQRRLVVKVQHYEQAGVIGQPQAGTVAVLDQLNEIVAGDMLVFADFVNKFPFCQAQAHTGAAIVDKQYFVN